MKPLRSHIEEGQKEFGIFLAGALMLDSITRDEQIDQWLATFAKKIATATHEECVVDQLDDWSGEAEAISSAQAEQQRKFNSFIK